MIPNEKSDKRGREGGRKKGRGGGREHLGVAGGPASITESDGVTFILRPEEVKPIISLRQELFEFPLWMQRGGRVGGVRGWTNNTPSSRSPSSLTFPSRFPSPRKCLSTMSITRGRGTPSLSRIWRAASTITLCSVSVMRT